jgi:hypothetical protein
MSENPKTPTEQKHWLPQTLLEAIRYFADEDRAHSFAATPVAGWASLPPLPAQSVLVPKHPQAVEVQGV